MSIANDIIHCRLPDFDYYLSEGETLDDIDEYGFTPLIESIITRQPAITKELLARGADVNTPDVTGRTPLHWAVDNYDLPLVKFLLKHKASPNAYTLAGLSVLVYPLLREQHDLKHLLYQHGAKVDFAMDFIQGKLLGHRFELAGHVDIVNGRGEFVELNYEGFILEFSVAILMDSLKRFTSSYSTRHLRHFFPCIYSVMDAFHLAGELLKLQHVSVLQENHLQRLQEIIQAPLLILPAASQGHALCFLRYGTWWAKIDRGENSLKESSVNIYHMTKPAHFTVQFLRDFLYKKQSRTYFHKTINQQLGLEWVSQLPISSQITGNCSWANVQAVLPVGIVLQELGKQESYSPTEVMGVYEEWVEWDKDRALDETLQRFYSADPVRKASFVAMLGAILFQACDYEKVAHVHRAEKILTILTLPQYYYVLQSYLDIYCVKRLTKRGNNLLKLLDDCGVNPNIGVTPIATGLAEKDEG